MEQHLTRHFKLYFSRAHGMPFTVESLKSWFAHDAQTQFTTLFKQGRIDVTKLDQVTLETHHELAELQQQPTDPPTIDTKFTGQKLQRDIRYGMSICSPLCPATILASPKYGTSHHLILIFLQLRNTSVSLQKSITKQLKLDILLNDGH
eukprot:15337827-Ditylum_brightwellii.AAC.1